MIQRIQSIYLTIVIVLSAILPFVFKLWENSNKEVFALDLFSELSLLSKLVPVFFFLSALIALLHFLNLKKDSYNLCLDVLLF